MSVESAPLEVAAPPDRDKLDDTAEAMTAPRTRRSVLAALLVIVGGVACFVPAVVHSLQTTSSLSGAISGTSTNYYSQVTCYRSTIEHRLPKNARVYLGPITSNEQLLVEASVTWATITTDPQDAQYTISLVPGSGCMGTRVQIAKQT
jgi:hypothetical protein